MSKEVVTADTILDWLKKQVENHEVIDPKTWIDAAMKLNVLLEDETTLLFTQGQAVKEIQLAKKQEGESVSASKLYAETTDEYVEYKKQEAKVERIQEAVRLAKIQSRQASETMGLKNFGP